MTDAVVIGAGVNGLVAANLLADAGWSVQVLEAEPVIGGAVRSDSEVHPGFVHDTFSAFYPFGVASPVLSGLGLEQHGLRWLRHEAALANPLPDGTWPGVLATPEQTAAAFEDARRGDGDAWLETCALWDRVGESLMRSLLSPFPPVRPGLSLLRDLAGTRSVDSVSILLRSVRSLGERFGGIGPRTILTGNAMHADFHPSDVGSGVFGWIMTMLAQHVGFPVPEGGAGAIPRALADRLAAKGGDVQCGQRVAEVEVRDGRAVGVRTADGMSHRADLAVLADVVAPHLYGGLVSWDHLPRRTRWFMRRFAWDDSTVKVDWALSGQVPWSNRPDVLAPCLHICNGPDELAWTAHQLDHGVVPDAPFLLLGQMSSADPTRSPAGTESMWAYTHVPREVREDAGDDGLAGRWDETECERFADRMQARIERLAPGFSDLVLSRRVLGPQQLQERNSNLVGGAINGGTAGLRQELVLRPVPGMGRPETPVRGLYLAGASAHPGGGVHGAPGANAARAALWRSRR